MTTLIYKNSHTHVQTYKEKEGKIIHMRVKMSVQKQVPYILSNILS